MELEKILKKCKQASLKDTLDKVNGDINAYTGGKYQDDVTMMGIQIFQKEGT